MLRCERLKGQPNPAQVIEYDMPGMLDDRIRSGKHIWDRQLYDWDWVGRKPIVRAPDGAYWFVLAASNEIGRIPALAATGQHPSPAKGGYPGATFYSIPAERAGLQNVTAAANGTIWFTERWAGKVGRIRPGGRLGGVGVPLYGIDEFPVGRCHDCYPTGIAVGADHNVWITNTRYDAPSISRLNLDSDNEFVSWDTFPIHAPGESDRILDKGQPREIIAGGDGNLWFTAGDAIVKMTLDGKMTWFHSVPSNVTKVIGLTGGFVPRDLAWGSDGNIWFTSGPNVPGDYDEPAIGRMSPSGDFAWFSAPLMADIESINSGPDGALWLTASFPEAPDYAYDNFKAFIGRIEPSQLSEAWYRIPSTIEKSCWYDFGYVEERNPNLAIGIAGSSLADHDHEWTISFLEQRVPRIGQVMSSTLPSYPPPSNVKEVTIAYNADGRLEVFALEEYEKFLGHVNRIAQLTPNGGWGSWGRVALPKLYGSDVESGNSNSSVSQIAAGRLPNGRLELFGVAGNEVLCRTWQTNMNPETWSFVEPFSGSWAVEVSISNSASGALMIFVIGNDGALYYVGQHNESQIPPWASLGGKQLRHSVVGKNADARLEIFSLAGKKSELRHISQLAPDGTWGKWDSLGGRDLRQVAIGNGIGGRLEAFAVGGDALLYHIAQATPAWGPWERLNDFHVAEVVVASSDDTRLRVFALGTDGIVYVTLEMRPGGWAPWAALRGLPIRQIAVGNNSDGRVEVFGVGKDKRVYHNWENRQGSWSDFKAL